MNELEEALAGLMNAITNEQGLLWNTSSGEEALDEAVARKEKYYDLISPAI